MFPEGVPDMQAMLQQAAAIQQQLAAAQEDLDEARVEGSSGGGLVHATVSGTGELLALTISPDACDPADPETLADLVIAAVRDASTTAQQLAAEQMSDLTGGLGAALGGLGGLGGAQTGQVELEGQGQVHGEGAFGQGEDAGQEVGRDEQTPGMGGSAGFTQ